MKSWPGWLKISIPEITAFITPYLTFILPLILIPLIMRIVIAPLILLSLKRKYVKELTSTLGEGWHDQRDLEAIEYLKSRAWSGLTTPFVISYNVNFLKSEARDLFISITSIYNRESEKEVDLKFSIQKILEAAYLMFEDLHRDLKKMRLYRFLEKVPLNMIFRVTKINNYLKAVTNNKFYRALQKYRISGKILRFILIPIFGIPIIIYQFLFSLIYSTIFEGYLRFIYGMALIKVGYYTIYLYSDRNSSLHNRLEFSHKDIIRRAKTIEEKHTKFNDRFDYSPLLNEAVNLLYSELEKEKIIPGKDISPAEDRISRIIKRVSTTVKNTIESELSSEPVKKFNFKPIIGISEKLAHLYFPENSNPLLQIRVKEAIECGFFTTTIFLKGIYTVPASKQLLDRIPLKLVVDISDYIEDKNLKKHIPIIKKGGRLFKKINSYYRVSRVAVKRSSPVIFAASMFTPILVQQVDDSAKEYVYNIAGKLLIDTLEATYLQNNYCRIEEIY